MSLLSVLRTLDLSVLEITIKDTHTRALPSIESSLTLWHRVVTSPEETEPVVSPSMVPSSPMRTSPSDTPKEDSYLWLTLDLTLMEVNSLSPLVLLTGSMVLTPFSESLSKEIQFLSLLKLLEAETETPTDNSRLRTVEKKSLLPRRKNEISEFYLF